MRSIFPLIPGGITNATLNIWNDGQDLTTVPGTIYNLYHPSSISFSGLLNGAVLGSVGVTAADSGVSGFVSIVLNSTALTLLNSSSGGATHFWG